MGEKPQKKVSNCPPLQEIYDAKVASKNGEISGVEFIKRKNAALVEWQWGTIAHGLRAEVLADAAKLVEAGALSAADVEKIRAAFDASPPVPSSSLGLGSLVGLGGLLFLLAIPCGMAIGSGSVFWYVVPVTLAAIGIGGLVPHPALASLRETLAQLPSLNEASAPWFVLACAALFAFAVNGGIEKKQELSGDVGEIESAINEKKWVQAEALIDALQVTVESGKASDAAGSEVARLRKLMEDQRQGHAGDLERGIREAATTAQWPTAETLCTESVSLHDVHPPLVAACTLVNVLRANADENWRGALAHCAVDSPDPDLESACNTAKTAFASWADGEVIAAVKEPSWNRARSICTDSAKLTGSVPPACSAAEAHFRKLAEAEQLELDKDEERNAIEIALDELKAVKAVADALSVEMILQSQLERLDGVPDRVRTPKWKSTRRKVERAIKRNRPAAEKLRSAEKRDSVLREQCGEKPRGWGFDGLPSGVERMFRDGARDPKSIEVTECTNAVWAGEQCWQMKCNVRGNNVFGVPVSNRYVVWFRKGLPYKARPE